MSDDKKNTGPGFVYGHPVTPKLTSEQQTQVMEMLGQGISMVEAAKRIGRPDAYQRVRVLARSMKGAQIQKDAQLLKFIPKALEQLLSAVTELQNHVETMNRQLTLMREAQRMSNKALLRRQMENLNLRSERRDLREERRKLKDMLWRHTGREL
jgi:transposase-like protein